MFSYKTRYYRKDGGLMMQRKFFWIWWDYEPHSNRQIAVKEKLNKLAHEAERCAADLKSLSEEEYRYSQDIDKARGEKPGFSQVFTKKMKMFPIRKKIRTIADNSWAVLVKMFSGGTSMAGHLAGIPGARVTSVSGHQLDGIDPIEPYDNSEFVGAKTMPINPESRNQQKKRGNNNQQQGQNNQQQ